jgi:tetratricopeptide (TPR) repeat protein
MAITVPYHVYEKYSHYILAGVILIGIGIGGGYAYRWYTISSNKLAQLALDQCLQEFERALQEPTLWPEVELAVKTGYYQHRNSSLSAYFLGLHADTLIQQNKLSEALAAIKESLRVLPKSSPLWYQYQNKYALMQLDSDDQTVKTAGLHLLESLASNTYNVARDQSLYYMGLYHWNNNDKEGAVKEWQTLRQTYGDEETFGSPWVALAQTKIESSTLD